MTVENPTPFSPGVLPGTATRVTVVASARLHLGFLDLGGSLDRRFGSLGVGIHEISTRAMLSLADRTSAEGHGAELALALAEKLESALGRPLPAAIRIGNAIPPHAGLGSGTQMGLAVGVGLARLHGLSLGAREIAPLIGRGARSGIGIAVFDTGGLVLDGGRGPATVVPPVLARLHLPRAWRFILVLDHGDRGLHGGPEQQAFRELPEFPAAISAVLCHRLLLQGLPAVVENDIAAFGAFLSDWQAAVGEHFASAQGGRFASPDVAEAIRWLGDAGAVGLGQSSWGPTGFCLVDGPAVAEDLLARARARFCDRPGLEFLMGTPRNRGAEIRVEASPG